MAKITKKVTHQKPIAAVAGAAIKRIVLPKPYRPQSFQPGNPGGPGRPKDDIAVKKLKKYTAAVISEMLNEMMELPLPELREKLSGDTTTGIQRAIAKALLLEDWATIDKILDRCIGKVPQKVINEGDALNENHTHVHLGGVPKEAPLSEKMRYLANNLSSRSGR